MHDEPPLGALLGHFDLRWTPPPGWAEAPEGFRPEPQWEPDPYWPKADGDWDFWQVTGDPATVGYFVDDDETLEPVQHWVAPPGWPEPPADFIPESGWEPDPRWPKAPADWKFWQVSDEARAEHKRTLVGTRGRRLATLNRVEYWLGICRQYKIDLPPRPTTKKAPSLRLSEPVRRKLSWLTGGPSAPSLHELLDEAFEGFGIVRDLLVSAIETDTALPDVYSPWSDEAYRRLACYMEWDQVSPTGAYAAREGRLREELREDELREGIVREDHYYGGHAGSEWQQAEQLAASTLRRMGFPDASVTAGGADGGIDVRGAAVVAQVKYTGVPIGRPVLQQLVGASGGLRPVFFSRSGYTAQAVVYAQQAGISLFKIELPGQVSAVNSLAGSLVSQYR